MALVLGEINQFVGVDMVNYGPYRPEDVARIPVKNAQNLAAKNLVRIISEAGAWTATAGRERGGTTQLRHTS